MEDNQNTEENAFSAEEVDRIIQDAIEGLLPGVQYDEKMVPHWINTLCEKITSSLIDLGKPYKY
jgi:dynein light chain Tctex-type 1